MSHINRQVAAMDKCGKENWDDWKWQMRNRLKTIDDFEERFNLSQAESNAIRSGNLNLKFHITPYLASLIDKDDLNCPIRKQVIPTVDELNVLAEETQDPLAEDRDSPVHGIISRYPDRAVLLVTTECASYCRFCTRSRIVGKPADLGRTGVLDGSIDYLAKHTNIRDVTVTGGDPLILPDLKLEEILKKLRNIPHLEIIRISTRVPIFLPQRVTRLLTKMISRYHPVWVNVNCNHPKELTSEAQNALTMLADVGIPLGSQSVLMAGINDCPNVIRELVHGLVRCRVRPYYLYQCDPVFGTHKFRTPTSKGIEIIESLRGHTSGYCVPTFVIDTKNGGGKVPLSPMYEISRSDKRLAVRNYEGLITHYSEPENYTPHDNKNCPCCQRANKTIGVSNLLNGGTDSITPEGWRSS